jgi:hypothetical protein
MSLTRTLFPLTVLFALTGAAALGVAISPVVPGASAPPAGGSCGAPPAPVVVKHRPELEGCREPAAAPAAPGGSGLALR